MAKHHVTATVNGDAVEFLCETEETLLDVLRDQLGLTGTKEGCSTGDCGACSVTVDGRLVCSCLMLGVEANGKSIGTIEGMARGRRAASAAAQVPRARRAAVRHLHAGLPGGRQGAAGEAARSDRDRSALLAGRQSVPLHRLRQDRPRRAGRRRRDERSLTMQEKVKDAPGSEFKYVGTRPIRPDGVDKVTGRARFGADLAMSGQLVGKVLRSPHPHARIKSIDTSAAEKLPGVKAVVTGNDFKDQPSEFIPAGEMMVNYRDVVRNVMAREKALYEGHAVAAVAATSAAVAKQALEADQGRLRGAAARHRRGRGDAARRAAAARGHVHDRRRACPQDGLQRRQARRVRARRRGGRLQAGRPHRRARVHHQARAPGLHRAARLHRQRVRGRPGRRVGVDAGPLDRARPLRAAARLGHRQDARDRGRDRRRVRRQDRRLSRADRAGAVQEGAPAGEDGDDARGGVPRLRPDVGRARARQDRRQEGRPHRRGRGRAQVPGRRLRRLAGAAGLHVRVRALRPRERQGGRLRRGDEPAEGRGLSRARRTDRRVRRRERDRRDRRQDRHGPDRAAPEERGQAGHQGRLRAEVRPDRHGRDAGSGQGARALAHAAQEEPGPRRRLGLLVQHRRRDVRVAVAQRGRHAVADGRHARHRRLARLAVHDGGRGAEGAARQDPRADRRHRPARLQLPHRRQPRHVLERHGDGGSRARGHEARPASAPPSCGSCRRMPSSTSTAPCVRPAPTPASTRR